MSQSAPSSSERQWRARRRYARIPILAPVEIYTKDTVGPPLAGRIDNLSVGGVLTSCRERFDLQTELAMLFQLPTGFRIHAFGRVIYVVPERHFGVAFIDLDQEARQHLEEFTQKMLGYARRSSRLPYRTHLTIRSLDSAGAHQEESADSVLVSRNGGLLVCRAAYTVGQEVDLWSPEKECGARARVVFQHVWATGGLVELGVEFLSDVDFWKIDFASEYD
ncbi:MAG TPA: PilZ domain-containing protein [Terriglobales bacterium]